MDDLIAFLRARLDETERATIYYRDGHPDQPCDRWSEYDPCERHIAASEATQYRDAAFGLADVASKRLLIGELLDYEAKIDGEWGCCHSAEAIAAGKCPEHQPSQRRAFRLLALPYAGHAGYREEWRV